MATKYVSPTGNNANTGNSVDNGGAWQTLTYALANASSGDTIKLKEGVTHNAESVVTLTSASANGKTLTITTENGNYVTVTPSGTINNLEFTGSGWASTSSFSFSNIQFISTGTLATSTFGVLSLQGTGAGAVSISFTNCTFDSTDHTSRAMIGSSSTTTTLSVSFTSCTINTSANSANYGCDLRAQFGTLSFSNCTFTGGTNAVVVCGKNAAAGPNVISFTNNTFTTTGLGASESTIYHLETTNATKRFIFTGNTVTTSRRGLRVQGGVTTLVFQSNTFTASGSGELAWTIGYDGAVSSQTIGHALVIGNTINYTGTGSHGIFVGNGVARGECAYNVCYGTGTGPDIGLVIKGCAKINAHHNVARGIRTGCIYTRGATDCAVHNNSFYRDGSVAGSECYCIKTDSIDASTDPARNNYSENLFYVADGASTSGAAVMISDAQHVGTTSIATDSYHRNIYRLQASLPFFATVLGGSTTNYTTIADARTQWLSYGTVDYLAFSDDSVEDPLFSSSTNLKIGMASSARGDSTTLFNNAGAYQYQFPSRSHIHTPRH